VHGWIGFKPIIHRRPLHKLTYTVPVEATDGVGLTYFNCDTDIVVFIYITPLIAVQWFGWSAVVAQTDVRDDAASESKVYIITMQLSFHCRSSIRCLPSDRTDVSYVELQARAAARILDTRLRQHTSHAECNYFRITRILRTFSRQKVGSWIWNDSTCWPRLCRVIFYTRMTAFMTSHKLNQSFSHWNSWVLIVNR
jgi:hypothetical protein